jgi:RNA polymerase sigma-70 factor (ECF subfamily)
MLGNRPDAEDVVQTLFVDLYRKGRTDVDLPYLYRAATTRSLNVLRDRRRRQTLLDRHGGVLAPRGSHPEEQVISAEFLAVLVGRLAPLSAEILVYHYQDHMTQDEIGEAVGLSRKTVGKKLQEVRSVVEALANAGQTP